MYNIKLSLDIELLREQITALATMSSCSLVKRPELDGVVTLLEEIIDQAEGVQTPYLTRLEQTAEPVSMAPGQLMGTPAPHLSVFWRPIDSAPKDKAILGFDPSFKRPFIMWWNFADDAWEVGGSAFHDETPTHWAYLPPAP